MYKHIKCFLLIFAFCSTTVKPVVVVKKIVDEYYNKVVCSQQNGSQQNGLGRITASTLPKAGLGLVVGGKTAQKNYRKK